MDPIDREVFRADSDRGGGWMAFLGKPAPSNVNFKVAAGFCANFIQGVNQNRR